jgi:deoxyuridine 5'-triphosphate nucleotidohydrolase
VKFGDVRWFHDQLVMVMSKLTDTELVTVQRIYDGAVFSVPRTLIQDIPHWLRPDVKVKLLRTGARAPQYMTAGAAAADVFADFSGTVDPWLDGMVASPEGYVWDHSSTPLLTSITFDRPGTRSIPLGIALEIPPGWVGQLKGRSGAAVVGHEAHLAYIDSDYRGEVRMLVHVGEGKLTINHGDRVGQIAFLPCGRASLTVVDELSETVRATGGFGSTGTR